MNGCRSRGRLAFTAVTAALSACAIVPLPPPVVPMDGVGAEPTGSTVVRAYATLVDKPLGGGGGAHVNHQFSTEWSGSLDAVSVGSGSLIYSAVRAGNRYSFLDDHLAFTMGLGGQLISGSEGLLDPAVTVDVGLRAGFQASIFEPYAALSVSGGFPIWKGGPYDAWLLASLGCNLRVSPQWRVGVDVSGPIYSLTFGPHAGGGTYLPSYLIETMNIGYLFSEPERKVDSVKWDD
jgi:hypothetical protein